jgi:hypothetical protein
VFDIDLTAILPFGSSIRSTHHRRQPLALLGELIASDRTQVQAKNPGVGAFTTIPAQSQIGFSNRSRRARPMERSLLQAKMPFRIIPFIQASEPCEPGRQA